MTVKLVAFLILIYFFYTQLLLCAHCFPFEADVDEVNEEDEQIVLAQVIYRHGERNPNLVCETDWFQEPVWSDGLAQLTSVGVEQEFALGKRLRKRYIEELKLVSPQYNSKQIYVRSADANRTLISAMANVAGFYDAAPTTTDSDEETKEEIEYTKRPPFVFVPVHTVPFNDDFLRPGEQWPERQRALINLLRQTPQFVEYMNEMQNVLDEVSAHCGEPVGFIYGDERMDTGTMIANYRILESKNMSLPEWLTSELREALENLTNTEVMWKNGQNVPSMFRGVELSKELTRTRSGTLLWTLIDAMLAKRDCLLTPNECRQKWARERRFVEYSAHDATIAALSVALGLQTNIDRSGYVPFASALLFELWQRRSRRQGDQNDDSNSQDMNADDETTTFFVKVLN